MNSKITVLDLHTANKIAAGEVVERPASIVKELVENAIDAGSTRIDIEITAGGLDSIKVTDNGEGMTPVDAELAFVRHATSKIRHAEDLFQISTLGFRGEALPSIAAVSKVQLFTRTTRSVEGTKLLLQAGKIVTKEPCGCSTGTAVLVKDIFFNTPARQKFLKSPLKEGGKVAAIVNRIALINPQIAFKLINDGRIILQTNGNNNLLTVIAQVYNTELAKNLLPIEYTLDNVMINGYIGQSFQYRANREMQHFFVNDRYIHNLKLSKALERGYQGTIPIKRYPICIVNIKIPPEHVDVNVHPTKLEVRLDKEKMILDWLAGQVQNTLQQDTKLVENVPKPKREMPMPIPPQVILDLPQEHSEIVQVNPKSHYGSYNFSHGTSTKVDTSISEIAEEKIIFQENKADVASKEQPKNFGTKCEDKIPSLQIIGQLRNSYILAQGEKGLYIIDQHAAHERIMYEELVDSYQKDSCLNSQTLAVPLSLELTYPETVCVIENILHFNSLGIILEHFGGNSFLVRGLPSGFTPQEGEELVTLLLAELQTSKDGQMFYDDCLKLMSCKKAVKANQKLTTPEMDYLLQKLNQTKFPFTCPHGRPTIIIFTLNELARKFLRT